MNPDDVAQVLATMLTHRVTTGLDLRPHKIDPLEARFYAALVPLSDYVRTQLPPDVVAEATTDRMEAELDDLVAANQPTADTSATANIVAWVDVLLTLTRHAYELPPNALLFLTGRYFFALRSAGLPHDPYVPDYVDQP
ncbi:MULTISPECIES: hypothetical protein [unclassified Crossiella]|uniref:hypothetical protein n=1 Tax=unclassified Crossiella TaxID=2620835 RepID=UPI001FFF90A9|nr:MULTISPECIES: hypothetical protein [unclassified Crossiella]MCK2240921.1 hypothetical protein [Crossiella sp. S99.2]MCK2253935.1 hypothetical protein [Crossiella sp. S99.1]